MTLVLTPPQNSNKGELDVWRWLEQCQQIHEDDGRGRSDICPVSKSGNRNVDLIGCGFPEFACAVLKIAKASKEPNKLRDAAAFAECAKCPDLMLSHFKITFQAAGHQFQAENSNTTHSTNAAVFLEIVAQSPYLEPDWDFIARGVSSFLEPDEKICDAEASIMSCQFAPIARLWASPRVRKPRLSKENLAFKAELLASRVNDVYATWWSGGARYKTGITRKTKKAAAMKKKSARERQSTEKSLKK